MKRFLLVMIVILLIATGYISELVQTRQVELQKLTRYTDSWSVSQINATYLRFEVFMSDYGLHPEKYRKTDVQLQIDILLSQIELLSEGILAQLTRETGKVKAVDQIKKTLNQLYNTLDKGGAGETVTELSVLKSFESVLAELASVSLARDIEAVNNSHKKIQALYVYYNYIAISLIILCLILGTWMVLQNHRLDQSNRHSNRLTGELKEYQHQLEVKNEKLRFEAHHDALTFLPNRFAFWKDLIACLDRTFCLETANAPGLMLFDLDLFKDVNDTYGHDAGDYLLKELAERLVRNKLHEEKTYRLGGDEFALIFFNLSPGDARALAVHYRSLIKQPYLYSGYSLHVDVSFGIAFTEAGTEPDILFKRADIALYEAKTQHTLPVAFFEDEMLRRINEERFIEKELINALERDEMMLYYQPIYSLMSGKVISYEVLARWKHPVRGFISPATFIPIAERTGLIHDLGEWILNTACEEISLMDTSVHIAVNVSPLQLRNELFLTILSDALARHRINPSRVELEITETSMLIDDSRTLKILNTLHEKGISISLDDFGTGYSSLSRLSSFPFNKIKIDQSFISVLDEHSTSINIIKAIVEVGKSLDMLIVAEGVETEQQMHYVKELGCDFVQGYLLGKPARFPEGRAGQGQSAERRYDRKL